MSSRTRTVVVLAGLLAAPLAAQEATPAQPDPELVQQLATAQRLVGAGRAVEAAKLVEPWIGDASVAPQARVLIGGVLLEAGRAGEALALLAPIAERPDAGPLALFHAGRAAAATGDARAESWLERAAAAAPKLPALRELGFLRGLRGDLVGSRRALGEWVARHPEDVDAAAALAYAELSLGDAAAAEALLEKLPETSPRVVVLRAEVALRRSRPKDTIALLEPRLAAGGAELSQPMRSLLAEAYLMEGRSREAGELFERAPPADARQARLAAQARFQTGDAEGAIALLAPWAARTDLPPAETAEIALEHGRHLLVAGRAAESVALLERATQLSPDDVEAWQLLAQARRSSGDREGGERALARLKQLLAERPTAAPPAAPPPPQ